MCSELAANSMFHWREGDTDACDTTFNTCLMEMPCVPQAALLTVVRRDSFAATEKEIFQALCRWCRQHGEGADTQEVMAAVRLPLMTLTEMLNVVRPSGLVSPDDLLDAIKNRSESRNMDLNYRGMLSQCS